MNTMTLAVHYDYKSLGESYEDTQVANTIGVRRK